MVSGLPNASFLKLNKLVFCLYGPFNKRHTALNDHIKQAMGETVESMAVLGFRLLPANCASIFGFRSLQT